MEFFRPPKDGMLPKSDDGNQWRVFGKPIGKGGQGTVYLAESINSPNKEPVVAKVLNPSRVIDGIPTDSHEIIIHRKFPDHRGIIKPYDALIEPDPEKNSYLILEFAKHGDFSQLIPAEGMPPSIAVPLFVQVAEGLERVHGEGVVLKDMKPSNLLLAENGAKISDFGSAEMSSDSDDPMIAGTPRYLAPEQFHGEGSTSESDMYGAGVSLWESITGIRPFDGMSDTDIAMQKLTGTAVLPAASDVLDDDNAQLREISKQIERLMQDNPEDRPTAHELSEALVKSGERTRRTYIDLFVPEQRIVDIVAELASMGTRQETKVASDWQVSLLPDTTS